MTTVCTSTAPSKPNEIVFYFGTYHSISTGQSVPGSVHITTPEGTDFSGAFVSSCSNGGAMTSHSSGSPHCPEGDLFANCPTSVLPADAALTCYAAHADGDYIGSTPTTYVVQDSCEAFPEISGNYAHFYAVVTNSTSGTYTVRTTGTDENLSPCSRSQNHPCKMWDTTSCTLHHTLPFRPSAQSQPRYCPCASLMLAQSTGPCTQTRLSWLWLGVARRAPTSYLSCSRR